CLQNLVASNGDFSCEAESLKCATRRAKDISDHMQKFEFKEACRNYKAGLDCLYQLKTKDPSCKVINHYWTFQEAKNELYKAASGLCGVDGSIDGCAFGSNQCMEHAAKMRDPANKEHCVEYIKMGYRLELLRDRMLCPKWIEKRLFDTLDQLKIELQLECFRTCDLALHLCVAEVPVNMTYDPKITEGEQEVLCAEIENAIDCINATDVDDLCQQEKQTAKWEESLQNQTANYKTFCCCSIDVEARVAQGVSTPQDISDLCLEFEKAFDCVNRTSMGHYCQGKNGAKTLATILNSHRHEMDVYCDPKQAQLRLQNGTPTDNDD
ncbi:hypothetical protein ElyMa_006250000, partial [Elysia marginata]